MWWGARGLARSLSRRGEGRSSEMERVRSGERARASEQRRESETRRLFLRCRLTRPPRPLAPSPPPQRAGQTLASPARGGGSFPRRTRAKRTREVRRSERLSTLASRPRRLGRGPGCLKAAAGASRPAPGRLKAAVRAARPAPGHGTTLFQGRPRHRRRSARGSLSPSPSIPSQASPPARPSPAAPSSRPRPA